MKKYNRQENSTWAINDFCDTSKDLLKYTKKQSAKDEAFLKEYTNLMERIQKLMERIQKLNKILHLTPLSK